MVTRFAPLKFNQIAAATLLHDSTAVYFDASWHPNCMSFRRSVSLSASHLAVLYVCDIKDDPDAETFVVETLHASQVPLLVLYKDRKIALIKHGIQEIEQFMREQKFELNLFNSSRSTLATLDILFQSDIGRVFIAGDKSSVGKSTMCLCILASLVRMGVSADKIAYIKPVTQCEAEQPIAR